MLELTAQSAAAKRNYASDQNADNRITENIVEKFIEALTELESAREVEVLITLFADDCEIGNVVSSEKFRGLEGARRFWTHYRASFKDVCSIFQNELYSGSEARLQWKTEGKSRNGRKINYEGVSILETKEQKITHFYAYFDRENLRQQIGVR